jgi:putative heme-binding domain-containing protein
VENKGDWNLIEILVVGNRIRFAANGTQVFDFTDKPEMLQESAIGLQLHSNTKAQEYHFRGLVLCENPEDRLITAKPAFSQKPEDQPVVERGSDVPDDKDESGPAISDKDFNAGPTAKWIWGSSDNDNYVLKTTFSASGVKAARLKASCDNVGTVFVNGKQVASSSEWQQPMDVDVAKHLVDGENTITAKVGNQGGVAAFVLKLAVRGQDGSTVHVVTDDSWVAAKEAADSETKVSLRGTYGDGPWGDVFSNAGFSGRVPAGVFEVPAGFQVQKLFTVPKDDLGSWVCIAFDNKGRLLASDQGNKGICRITPPALDSASGDASETIVEHLDFSGCEFQPSGAQGMLYAFDSLYLSVNGGPGSGLYRARDTDGDDQFDECVRLKEFRGGGEHGPHSLRLSPDGQRIFVIAGNHTDPPFRAGEELQNENYSSRIPTNWGEDLLLPRMWDANGHARGKLAPGGWIASTDADGKSWEIWSVGYRNPYDMAFNADGELFAYDADMEWDVGTPWYRPTRVVHATSGSEYGWRSGTGKWPAHYIDSLPQLVDIGPGSPVGVDFGYGLSFPAKYQKALYICDWTFGTMYAIHLEPHQSTYKATKEEFVARTPLPLTDCAAGPDGALYFTIGGRGTQSELYRVIYAGDESTAAVPYKNSAFASDRSHRHELEQYHGFDVSKNHLPPEESNAFLQSAVSDLESGDRALLTASRNAFFKSHVLWQGLKSDSMINADLSEVSPQVALAVVTAFARAPLASIVEVRGESQESVDAWKRDTSVAMLRALKQLQFSELSGSEKLDYLRALSLVFMRLAEPDDSTRAVFIERLDPQFPAGSKDLDRELCQMLVYLQSPTVVAKTVALMKQESEPEDIDMGELLTRNAGYGRAIRAMIENQPDKQQMWYAFCLRVAKAGWTADLRADYFRWFEKTVTWSGGNSLRKFLQNIENEAWDETPFDHRVLVEKAGARTPFTLPELPKPSGPGKDWTIDEVRELAKTELKGRSFENGQKMFAATRCVLCHRFAGNGGATGPDLTQLAGRFNVEALTEAIMDPSKVISDQYKASTVVTAAGKTVVGRIVSENDEQISVLTDPEDSTKIADIPKEDIDEILASKISIMPADLLKPLNKEEVLDLLAYLLSRGDERNAMFAK